MSKYYFTVVFFLSLLFGGAVAAQTAEPEINACDRSVLTPESRAKSGWTSQSGGPWVAFNMEKGFALCLYSDRYLVFSEKLKGLESVSVSTQTLTVRASSSSGMKTDYIFNIAGLASAIEPYRGESATLLASARIMYAEGADAPSGVFIPLSAGRPDAGFSDSCLRYAGDNWLWANKSVMARFKAWVSERLSKKKPHELEDCSLYAGLKLDIPRSRLPKYLEVVAHRKGKDPVSAVFRSPAAELVCVTESGQRFQEVLPEGELLKVFR